LERMLQTKSKDLLFSRTTLQNNPAIGPRLTGIATNPGALLYRR
jgi:hypothetical protein